MKNGAHNEVVNVFELLNSQIDFGTELNDVNQFLKIDVCIIIDVDQQTSFLVKNFRLNDGFSLEFGQLWDDVSQRHQIEIAVNFASGIEG
jgi:hypothetical protein